MYSSFVIPKVPVDLRGLTNHGWLTQEEANLLYACALLCDGPILEVGAYYGRSAVLLARTKRQVYTVDPFAGFDSHDMTGATIEASFYETARPWSNIQHFKSRIEEWVARPCGFCYLDGNHSREGTIQQIVKALQCSPNWIAVHDVNDKGGGLQVKQACLDLLGPWHERVGSLAVFYIKPKLGADS